MIYVYIYKITNLINGKVYIGQTVRDVQERFREHCRHEATAIDKAIKKYGKENFSVEVLCEAKSIGELNELEIKYISLYNSTDRIFGYNMCDGGDNTCGFHHSEQAKEKMRKSRIGMYEGKNNPFYGKHHSSEQIEKWSKERKGRKLTEEWKRNIGKAQEKQVINLDTGEVFESVTAAAESCGAPATHITRVCRGKRKTSRGYRWAYGNTVPSSNTEKV